MIEKVIVKNAVTLYVYDKVITLQNIVDGHTEYLK